MKYSIIIPHLNEGFYLNAMLDSIYTHVAFDDYEIIIVDDGSIRLSDLEFVEMHPLTSMTRIIYANNLGSAMARNTGAKEARGEYLIFLDAHMYIETDILSYLDSLSSEYDCMQMVVGNYADKSNKGLIYRIRDLELNSGWTDPVDSGSIVPNPCSSGAATIIAKKVFDDIGGFNPNIRKWGTEDLEMPMRLWLRGYTCILNQSLVIVHYFKEKFENTVVSSEDVIFNRIMFAHVCFQNQDRRTSILNAIRNTYGTELFESSLKLFLLDSTAQEWIHKQQIQFKFNDDWYVDKFKQYYPHFILNS